MGRARRKWNPEEDALLRTVVSAALAESRPLLWRELAKDIPGRSNKDCRRRWWNSLADGTAKGLWSENEDAKLIQAVKELGTNWRVVAQYVGSRTSDQCSSHWTQVLDPEINHCNWTSLEDDQLHDEVLTHGTNWTTISAFHMPRRTTLALKNRYSRLRLKRENKRKRRLSVVKSKFDRLSSPETLKAQQVEPPSSCVASRHRDGERQTEPESDVYARSGCDAMDDDLDDMASGVSTLGSVASADMEQAASWSFFFLDESSEVNRCAITDGSDFSQLWKSDMDFSTFEEFQSLSVDPMISLEAGADLYSLMLDPSTPQTQAFELNYGTQPQQHWAT